MKTQFRYSAFLVATALFLTGLQAQEAVPVDAGSYATFPSPQEDSPNHDVSGVLTRPLYIDPSQEGKPVPTNAWWTDLIIRPYAGDMWARPFTVSANETGARLHLPDRWNAEGTAFEMGVPLDITGDVSPASDPSDILMADFEGSYPVGWTLTGTAFGAVPAVGTLPGQSVVSGQVGEGLANSFHGGDGSTGSLVSPDFIVDRDYIAFMVGGGNHPGEAEVRLVVNGVVERSATGVNSEALRWEMWDVREFEGMTARVEVVDQVTGGWGHILADQIFRTNSSEDPAVRYTTTFSPVDARALRWGDWNVAFRMKQATGASLDVSLARGVPYVWLESNGVRPRLKTGLAAEFNDAAGDPLVFPATTDRFSITLDGKHYGVHAPAGSTFTYHEGSVGTTLTAPYLVISALPSPQDLDAYHARAFAVVRDSRLTWQYSPAAGKVTTSWNLETEALQGSNLDTLQGWLPHHYRGTSHDLDFVPGISYATPRGPMPCTAGHGGWEIQYAFEGIAPVLPLPETLGKANDFDPAILRKYLTDYASDSSYGGDTYWGGKSLTQFADYMLMAKQAGETAAYETLKNSLRTALEDWFTYTPGETENYFAAYSSWGAIVGFNDSYGSHEFVDHHFHYGYFTRAAGLLAFEDPDFAAGYGRMATYVAQQYANWDREDPYFPFMRTFDAWSGHSYAGGFSSPGGNNQESSSEAIQSWAGLFMLGSALKNEAMRDAGVMGYVMERAATREYWLDVNGDLFAPSYAHSTTGILNDNGPAYATYFSGDPGWIYGIQWLPAATHLSFLGWDPAFSKELMADMIDDRPITLANGVAGLNRYSLWESRKSWYGVHGNALNRDYAINDMKNAINNAYLHNPGYVTAADACNPLYDPVAEQHMIVVHPDGTIGYPVEYWTPGTLPASLIPPPALTDDDREEPVSWSLWQYLGVQENYLPDMARMHELYYYDVRNYDASETEQAAGVYARMGDGLGNVVLGFAAQYDPDFYADVHATLWARQHPVAHARSMAGAVYYMAYSHRGLGVPVIDRYTDLPTSQVYFNPATNSYSYVVYNPEEEEVAVTVRDADTGNAVGSFPVPGKTQVSHGLDQQLETLVITAPGAAKTFPVGTTLQFQVTGYDQYGATSPLGGVTWASTAGGSISSTGLFTATGNTESVRVTALSDGRSATYSFRVAPAPVLLNLAVSPAFARLTEGGEARFTVGGLDQYGDPFPLDEVTWETTLPGAAVDETGLLATSANGIGYVTARVGEASGSALVSAQAPQTNLAFGKIATASDALSGNVAGEAVDGLPGTRWETPHGSDDHWFMVDLGDSYDLSRIVIDWEFAYASSYRLQVADHENGPWQTLRTIEKTNANDDDVPVSGSGRFVRIQCLTRGTAYGYSFFEFEVYGWLRGDSVTTSSVFILPQDTAVYLGSTASYQAYAFDSSARGGPVSTSGWSVSGGGTISASGIFEASTPGGPFTVTAAVDAIEGSGQLRVVEGEGEAPELVNVAIGKAASASSEQGPFVASAAIDSNLATRWASLDNDDEFIEIDLGESHSIRRIDLSWEAAYGRDYRIQTRQLPTDEWMTVITRTHGIGGEESHEVNVTARYIRLQGDARGTIWGYSLWEFAIYAPAPQGLNLALGKTATASSVEDLPYAASSAVDGSLNSRWASDATDNEWLAVDLGSAKSLSSVKLVWEAAYASSYVIEATNDPDGVWTLLASEVAGAGGTEILEIAGSYRHVRMRGIQRATPWGYSLWEFEIR